MIKVNQSEKTTKISIGGTFPKFWIDTVCMLSCLFTGIGFFAWLIYSIIHLGFEEEIIEVIKNNPEFYPNNKPQ
ncbi:MAG: hypothetical protein FK734_15995 [Asgard group archaeon]|nr:hypothetical protein [Asgard group archaeon]